MKKIMKKKVMAVIIAIRTVTVSMFLIGHRPALLSRSYKMARRTLVLCGK